MAQAQTSESRRGISRVPYLPGLDGVRALAVVAVMLYHAEVSWLPGGFLGVEVFFVISGYLITLLLIAEYEKSGRISLKGFWSRRARRLLPALVGLVAGLLTLASLVPYLRHELLAKLRVPSFWALFYGSNWWQIYAKQSYFDSRGRPPLLRHLWSLAVEEQYYLVWPLIMIVALRLLGKRLPRLAGVFLGAALLSSLWMAVHYDPANPNRVYLGTDTRASGLLLGAAMALVWRPYAIARSELRSRGRLLSLVGILGTAILAFTMFVFHEVVVKDGEIVGYDLLYRGGFLLVGLATMMVIASTTHLGSVYGQRVLGNRALAWLGTRSYGLYLWHWPVFQLMRPGRIDEGGDIDLPFWPLMLLRLAVTMVVTELSYRFIETPVRKRRVKAWLRTFFGPPSPELERRQRRVRIVGSVMGVLALFVGVSVLVAKDAPSAQQLDAERNAQFTNDLEDVLASGIPAPSGATTVPPSSSAPVATEPAPGVTADPTSTTTSTLPPTTLPPKFERLAIGDSVMLGAAAKLKEQGFWVDAVVGRQVSAGLDLVRQVAQANAIGDIVVIHLGNNGPATQERYDEIMQLLAPARLVLVLTCKVPKPWQDANNGYIYDLPARFPNVRLVDWNGLSQLTDGVFYSDGTHLRDKGQQLYTDIIMQFIAKG